MPKKIQNIQSRNLAGRLKTLPLRVVIAEGTNYEHRQKIQSRQVNGLLQDGQYLPALTILHFDGKDFVGTLHYVIRTSILSLKWTFGGVIS